MSTFTRRAKRAHAVTLSPDVYAGRILAAKLEVIDDIAKALGVEPNEDELGTLREGYIARAREQALAAIAPIITPRMTRKLALQEKRAKAHAAKLEAEAKTQEGLARVRREELAQRAADAAAVEAVLGAP